MIDYLIFCIAAFAVFAATQWIINRNKHVKKSMGSIPMVMMIFIILLVIGGYFFTEIEERKEKENMSTVLSSLTSTMTYELQEMGHEEINLDTIANDPIFNRIIEKMNDWMSINQQIESIYTLRMLPSGEMVIIVGAENKEKQKDRTVDDQESQVIIGEPFTDLSEELLDAYDGNVTFQTTSRMNLWDTTTSAYAPIYNKEGKVDGVLAIHFVDDWYSKISESRLKAIGLLTMILLLFICIYWVLYQYHRSLYSIKKREDQLYYLAYYDSMTGLPNRFLRNELLAHAIEQANKHQYSIAVLALDIDDFKYINDSIGHEVGDLLLKEVSQRLINCLTEDDIVSRYTADEFSLILPNTNRRNVVIPLNRIYETLGNPFYVKNHEMYITTSIGISFYPEDARNVSDLLKCANIALNQAKSTGKNSYQLYTPIMNQQNERRLELQAMLHKAIEREEFLLNYQPQVNLRTGKLIGIEALVRWQHPEYGLIPPDHFIPLAEEIGLINPLGEWIIHTACTQVKKWNDFFEQPIRLAINLSAVQFRNKDIVEVVANIIEETKFSSRLLELEITESMAMDVENTIDKLNDFKKIGIQISIDDFGTGYSSLNYLKEFPIDRLKIDKSFVQGITKNSDDKAIVSTIISMAHHLNLSVIAEGLETVEQLKVLKAISCDEAQGYIFSKPLSVDEFEQKYIKDYENTVIEMSRLLES